MQTLTPFRQSILLYFVFCLEMRCPTSACSASQFASVQEGVQIAHNTSDKKEQVNILHEIANMSIQNSADVQALYDEMQSADQEIKQHYTLAKDSVTAGEILDKVHALHDVLSNAVLPGAHDRVAKLLDQESGRLPKFYAGAREETSQEQYLKDIPREECLQALLEAAGKGKNREALSVIRNMAKRKDFAGSLAVRTISQIGDPQDLDNFINQIKKDPTSRLDLSGYGSMLTDRVLSEINRSASPQDVRRKLAGYLVQSGDHAGIPRFLPLLKDKDRVVARIAATAIARSATSADLNTLQILLKDPDEEIKIEALGSLENRTWNPAWTAILINILQKDNSDSCRMMAAHILGKYKVQGAKVALENALKDQSALVRGAAQSAIQDLSK